MSLYPYANFNYRPNPYAYRPQSNPQLVMPPMRRVDFGQQNYLPQAIVYQPPIALPNAYFSTAYPNLNLLMQPPRQLPVQPKPINITIPENAKVVDYSTALALVQSGQVKRAEVNRDPNSFTAIPTGDLFLNNGRVLSTVLPNDTQEFRRSLDQAQIPYAIDIVKPKGLQMVVGVLKGALQELLLPTLLLSATGLSGYWAYNQFQKQNAQKGVHNTLAQAVKRFDNFNYDVSKIIHLYDEPTQRTVNDFVNGRINVLLAKGPPGTGKSHLLNSVGKTLSASIAGTLASKGQDVLFLNLNVSDSVIELLENIYSGDQDKSAKALATFKKLNGGKPIRQIIVYADEIENMQNQITELFNKGLGNPEGTSNLPTLRVIATCNEWPAFGLANKSRINAGKMLVLHAPPSTLASIFMEKFQRVFPGVDISKHREPILNVFKQYPGYSTRNVSEVIFKKAVAQYQAQPANKRSPAQALEEALKNTYLDDSEISGLIVSTLTEFIMNGLTPLLPNSGEALKLRMADEADRASIGLDDILPLNGKDYKKLIVQALADQDLSIHDGDNRISETISSVGRQLKRYSISRLLSKDAVFTSAALVRDQFVKYVLQEQEKLEKELEESDGTAPMLKDRLEMLEKLRIAIRNPLKGSPVYSEFLKAGKLYNQLVKSGIDSELGLAPDVMSVIFSTAFSSSQAQLTDQNELALMQQVRRIIKIAIMGR